jgi:hypothetical protein
MEVEFKKNHACGHQDRIEIERYRILCQDKWKSYKVSDTAPAVWYILIMLRPSCSIESRASQQALHSSFFKKADLSAGDAQEE